MRLLREKSCTQYACQVVPCLVDGVQIQFPEIEISLGLDVTVRSRRIKGRLLLDMLYDPEMSGTALNMGIVALRALHQANVSSAPPFLSDKTYEVLRGAKIVVSEMLGSTSLTARQRIELWRLVAHHLQNTDGDKVLLHGDLHPSNVIINIESNSLGFIDLEAMRVGTAATNFAPLWGAYHFADPILGQRFYEMYAGHFPSVLDDQFCKAVKAELALRSCLHIREAVRTRKPELENKACQLLALILSGTSFDEICYGGAPIES